MMQILGITGDNASNNDSMIQYLGNALDKFPGTVNQTRCFVHAVNLIAKSILKPFNARKIKDICEFNDIALALADLAKGHNLEGGRENATDNIEDSEDIKEENVKEGKADEEEEEEEEKEEEFNTHLGPIRSMLLKVCLFTFLRP